MNPSLEMIVWYDHCMHQGDQNDIKSLHGLVVRKTVGWVVREDVDAVFIATTNDAHKKDWADVVCIGTALIKNRIPLVAAR